MSQWSPTHVQFTVLRARNLVAKGKGGNNDVFATIQLGREKFQTSTIKNALNPEWFEECDLPIPHMHSMVEVTLYHRGLLSDDFLGYAAVPIWEHNVSETPRSSWVSLQSKPSTKSNDSKYRGELEVKITFHCQSKTDFSQGGLKKRTSSIRNLASVFGDKFRFTRSRSFRENRRDPEGEKMDRGHSSTIAVDGRDDNLTRSYSMSAAYIKSMSLERGPKLLNASDANSTSVANSNTVSSRGVLGCTTSNVATTSNSNSKEINSFNNATATLDRLTLNGSLDWIKTNSAQMYSQSVYNLPGERRSCAPELLPNHVPSLPLARCVRSQSQDDSALSGISRDYNDSQSHSTRGNRGRTMSDILIGSNLNGCIGNTNSIAQDSSGGIPAFLRPPPPPPSSSLPVQIWRDQFYATAGGGGGIYESIKERTEPENSVSSSSSSTSDGESVPIPKSKHTKRSQKKPGNHAPIMGREDLLQQQQQHQQQIQQLYRQPHKQPNNSNIERSMSRRDPSPTKSVVSTCSVGQQHPIPPPPLPSFRSTPRPNSYPNSTVPFSTSPSLDGSQQNSEQLQALNVRDSGIMDDRSSSQGNSLEGSGLTTPDCVSITGLSTTAGTATTTTAVRNLTGQGNTGSGNITNQRENHLVNKSRALDPNATAAAAAHKPGAGGILFHLDQELALKRGIIPGQHQADPVLSEGMPSFPGHWHRRENSQGELVIRKRSRGERDRLRQARQAQGNRRYTVQNMESCPPGAYSDSQSEASASPRQEVPESLMTVYSNMNKEELLRVVIQSKAQMIRKDQYIRDLETYIDDLLVRVMETTPRLLGRPNMLRL